MNVAYLDPPYSRYFHELAARLAQTSGGKVVALLSCPAYRLYAGGDRAEVWEPGVPAQEHVLPPAFERAGWAQPGSPAFGRAFSHAVEWFKERFAAERTDICLVFSDARPFSQAAHLAAQELGVVCVFFERGAFRYRTASLSTQGLNARFCLKQALGSPVLEAMPPFDLPPRRAVEPWLKLRFVGFMALNGLLGSLWPQRRPMQHKSYHFFNYLRIALKQFGAEHPELPLAHAPELPPTDGPVVVLPLQLPTDSQFVMYSPFRHNQELIDFVARQMRAALPATPLLVKKHPMDVRSYRLPASAHWIDGSLARFHERPAVFVCLNSNVGFEAAIHGKPVLCFADSFYTGHPSVTRVSREDFARQLTAAAARPDDPVGGRALLAAVLREYQSPGDVWAYVEADLDFTATVLLQQVRSARGAFEARKGDLPADSRGLSRPAGAAPLRDASGDASDPSAV